MKVATAALRTVRSSAFASACVGLPRRVVTRIKVYVHDEFVSDETQL
jgi:hypothetical protein